MAAIDSAMIAGPSIPIRRNISFADRMILIWTTAVDYRTVPGTKLNRCDLLRLAPLPIGVLVAGLPQMRMAF